MRDTFEGRGFLPVHNWPSVFHHKERNLLFMVYVEDFKMSGPAEHMAKTWDELSKRIAMDKPGLVGKCLGCHHHVRPGMVKRAGRCKSLNTT